MIDGYDEAIRIVYEDDGLAGGIEQHKHAAPSRRETLQALLSAQLHNGELKSRVAQAHYLEAWNCEPFEEPQGAAHRAPLPLPQSPRSAIQQHAGISEASGIASGYEETCAGVREAEHMPSISVPHELPKPTLAELKAEIASAPQPHRSEQSPQRQRYRTPQRQRKNAHFAANWSNNSSATPISRHVRNLHTDSASGQRAQRRISSDSGEDGLPVVPSVRRTLEMLQSQSDAAEQRQEPPPESISNSGASGPAEQTQSSKEREDTDAPISDGAAASYTAVASEASISPSGGISAMRRFLAENAPTAPRPQKRLKAPVHTLAGQLNNALQSRSNASQAEGPANSIALTLLARRLEGSLIVARCSLGSESESPDLFAVFSTRHGADLTALTVGTMVAAEPLHRLQLPDGHKALLCCRAIPISHVTSPSSFNDIPSWRTT